MKTFLRLHARRDRDDDAFWKTFPQQRDHERLRRRADAVERQRSALLHAPQDGLHGGSVRDLRENVLLPFDRREIRSRPPERQGMVGRAAPRAPHSGEALPLIRNPNRRDQVNSSRFITTHPARAERRRPPRALHSRDFARHFIN